MNDLISIGSTNTLKTRKASDNLGLNCPKDDSFYADILLFFREKYLNVLQKCPDMTLSGELY